MTKRPSNDDDDEVGGCCPFFSRKKPSKGLALEKPPINPAIELQTSNANGKVSGNRSNAKNTSADLSKGIVTLKVVPVQGDQPSGAEILSPDKTTVSQRRIKAEQNFERAADKLQHIMPGDQSDKYNISQAIGFQQGGDVAEAGKKIESAIDGLIVTRRDLNESASTIKEVKKLFKASFPYIKVGLKVVGVRSH